MKRWITWAIAAAALLGVGALAAKRFSERQQPSAKAAMDAVFILNGSDVVAAAQQEMVHTLQISGSIKAVNTALVKAKVAAEVKSLTVREGDRVRAGQVIGQLDTAELQLKLRQAEQNAASSKAQRDIAKRALDNSRALVAQGFISPTGLETSVSNAASAQASLQAAQAAVDLARKALADAQLVAPISGLVSMRWVQPGERVSIDARLAEIVDLSRLEIEATVTPEDAVQIKIGQLARMDMDGLAQPLVAKVARINPSTQAGTRAIGVYLALSTQTGLRQGLFATGHIDVERQTRLVLPVSSVRIDQALPYVVALENGVTAQRSVTLGSRGDALIGSERESVVEIKAGLAAGTTVLRGSVGKMRDGTAVRVGAAAAASAVR
jgi:membrane fusion protein, multidrug efflux system